MRSMTLFSAALLALPLRASAEVPVEIVDRASARLTVDGVIREWGADFATLGDRADVVMGAQAWRGAADASVRFALARDSDALWLAAEITDDRLVRSAQRRAGDDALVLTFSVDGGPVREIALFPGEPGRLASAARWVAGGAGAVAGVDVVESAAPQGVTLEARIPWSSLPGVGAGFDRLRLRVAYRDGDGGGPVSLLATGPGSARAPRDLSLTVNARRAVAPRVDLLEAFRAARGLAGVAALLDRSADLGGDASPERVVVLPGFLFVSGPGVEGGAGYRFAELAARDASDLSDLAVRDVTGDGKSDVVIRQRVRAQGLVRELVTVYALDGAGVLRRVFAHEVSRSLGVAALRNTLSWPSPGVVRVALAQSQGWTREQWADGAEGDVMSPLTPWGAHRARVYRWSAPSGAFAVEASEPNPSAPSPTAAATGATATAQPAAPQADVAGVFALFRQREGLSPTARPSHRATGDVVEDATPEELQVYGRVLVVAGPRFMGGRSFYSLSLPITDGDEVTGLEVVDVTGDHRGEAVVRVRRHVTTRVQGAEIPSQRELLLAYSVDPARRGRVFAAEIARRVAGDSITNVVELPRRGGDSITLRAGRATGWTEANYPFHDAPQERVFPLLLPWDPASQRVVYRWNGTGFARAP